MTVLELVLSVYLGAVIALTVVEFMSWWREVREFAAEDERNARRYRDQAAQMAAMARGEDGERRD